MDPTSHTAAAAAGWSHPVSLEWAALADLFDLYVAAHAKKGANPKPYDRPWSGASRGRRPAIDPEIKSLLARNAGREVTDGE